MRAVFLLGKSYLRNQFTETELKAMGIKID